MKRIGVVLVVAVVLAGCLGRVSAPNATPTAIATSGPTSSAPVVRTPKPTSKLTSKPTSPPTRAPASATAGPTYAQLIGQKLVVRMDGTTPSADLLGRIGRGEVGGVILFGANVTTRAALIALTGTLRAAAAAGGQPPLLIAVDQEGGAEKRIPWAPPNLSPPEMGRGGDTTVARAQGASTGTALDGLGINVDFAPVADVPASSRSFMYRDGRTFSFSAATTAELADAFASGLESAGVLPTMKHFPGIGFATENTDASVVTITASTGSFDAGLGPYRTAIDHHIPLIMLSNATYPVYDPVNAAGWSPAVAETLLRHDLGFTGVTITDSLDGTAHARGIPARTLAVWAALAGTDMILTTGSEAATRAVYATLLGDAMDGSIRTATLRASYDRILALKAGLQVRP